MQATSSPETLNSTLTRISRKRKPACNPHKLAILYKFVNFHVVNGIREVSLRSMARSYAQKSKIPPMRVASKTLILQSAFSSVATDPDLVMLAVTINLNPKHNNKGDNKSNRSYFRDSIRKAIAHLFDGHPIYFSFVLETAITNKKERRPHFHGFIAVPSSIYTKDIESEIEEALEQSPISNRYVKRYKNKTVKVTSSCRKKESAKCQITFPVNQGWFEYSMKVFDDNTLFFVSKELRTRSKKHYNHVRNCLS